MEIETQLFSPIRYSSEFRNAYGLGLALNMYRPGHEAVKDFYINGNLFKGMNKKRLRGFETDYLENLPAICSSVLNLVRAENG